MRGQRSPKNVWHRLSCVVPRMTGLELCTPSVVTPLYNGCFAEAVGFTPRSVGRGWQVGEGNPEDCLCHKATSEGQDPKKLGDNQENLSCLSRGICLSLCGVYSPLSVAAEVMKANDIHVQ